MKKRKLIDLYLPPKWGYHTRILLVSVILVFLIKLFSGTKLIDAGTIHLFLLLLIQFEFFIWLGKKFFLDIKYTTAKEYARRIIIRLLLFFAVAFLITSVFYTISMLIVFVISGQDLSNLIPHILKTESTGFIIGASSGFLLGALFFFYVQWLEALKREQKLREEKLIFQYETLKNQVNPHFLFNSLNTLSSLVSKDTELSEKYILKLSYIYRYILEKKELDIINLNEEIEFVQDYFYLQKVRDDGKIDLILDVEDSGKYLILPISLQLLVENAFKHNAATREDPLVVKIKLDDQKKIISVSNNLKPKIQIENSSQIGLSNLSKRNKLLTGRDIEIIESKNTFTVHVPLKIREDEGIDH
jgi:LytS/YehU family sensor histidine kinase